MSIASAASRPLTPLVRRVWKGAGIMAMLVAVFLSMNTILPVEQQLRLKEIGHDFLAFYTAGTFVREGDFTRMYEMMVVRDHQFGITRELGIAFGPGFMPWWNPPFAALIISPLTLLPYQQAVAVWIGINVLCVAIAAVLLTQIVRQSVPDPRRWALVPVCVFLSIPFFLVITHGQNTGISLLLLSIVVTLWRTQRGLLAGIVCGLMFYKPQLATLVAVALTIRLGWRAALGVALSGTALLMLTLAAMPGALSAFLHKMPANLTWFQEANAYYWERHVTFKGLWRLLIQGHDLGPTSPLVVALWAVCASAVGIGLMLVLWRRREPLPLTLMPAQYLDEKRRREDRAITATVASSPLLMPFYFDYDLLLMAVPIALFAIDRYHTTTPTALDRWTPVAWGALVVSMLLQPHVAEQTHVNVNAIVLVFCTGLTIARGLHRDKQQQSREKPIERTSPQRAAA